MPIRSMTNTRMMAAYVLFNFMQFMQIGHVGKMSVSGYSDQRFEPDCNCMLGP